MRIVTPLPTERIGLLLLLIISYLVVSYAQQQKPLQASAMQQPTLSLKHIYHHSSSTGKYPNMFRRMDFSGTQAVHIADSLGKPSTFSVKQSIGRRYRPASPLPYLMRAAQTPRQMHYAMGIHNMEIDYGLLPDVADSNTVLSLAEMTNNAYSDPNTREDWYDLGTKWNVSSSFGWESDGLRGHVFGDADNTTFVLSFKGTSAGLWTGGPTGEKDKFNDNLLFSCCCARVSRAWRTVCDCYVGNTYQCNQTCLESSLLDEETYYSLAMRVYIELADQYPDATIWLSGHSLGGSVASLVGQTFGVPTVTFEIPGERLASRRFHLPGPPAISWDDIPLWHFGHTADPLFVGVCTGPSSTCWYGGFAMETRCHAGKVCVWDVVNEKGWRVDIRSHRIHDVIENILKKPEEFPIPECKPELECVDCALWDYPDDRDPPSTMSTTCSTIPEIPEPTEDPWRRKKYRP
ncbi:unnamed protein product [Umbelopsis ramanniana]